MNLQRMKALAITSLAACSCAAPRPAASGSADDMSLLTRWMTGSFSSAEQAAHDPANFREVVLHMTPIWLSRRDGPWLYVEQAMADAPDKPYRQRIYRLSADAGSSTFTSAVFELPGDPLRFAGAWRRPDLLSSLDPSALSPRTGCSITLRRDGGAFAGSTLGKECLSTLRGAAYATSEVTITQDCIRSWDRGFDSDGVQRWGAVSGGYEFRRIDSAASGAGSTSPR